MVISRRTRSINVKLRRLDLPLNKVTSQGTKRLTQIEKLALIKKTEEFQMRLITKGKLVGKNIILLDGKRFTKSGVLL